MDRKDEYYKLLEEIDNTPHALEYTLTRAEAKLKKQKHKRFWKIPAASVFASFAAFVVLVNTSTAFASACGQIPLLKELAKAVSFSPSLSAAVESQYVQPIGIEESENGITMRIEHVIVDQRQLNIFYTLDSDKYSQMVTTPWIRDGNMQDMESFSISAGEYESENGEIRQYTVDFFDDKMPSSINLIGKVYDNEHIEYEEVYVEDSLIGEPDYKEPDYLADFKFKLDFDPSFTATGEIINLEKDFILDGQKLSLQTAEIFPTHMRLVFDDYESNTAWLKGLEFYIKNEKWKKFEKISNGITASGKIDSPMMETHMLESPFFAKSKHLTLNITGVQWLEKDMEKVKIDLENQTAEKLPQGVKIHDINRKGDSWILAFEVTSLKENHSFSVFDHQYYDEEGNEYSYNSWSNGIVSEYDEKKETTVSVPNKFLLEFALTNYPDDIVYLKPIFSEIVTLEEPVAIVIK